MAAGLVEMAARFSPTWDGAEDAAVRARRLRERALPLAQRDAEGYEAVLRAAPADRAAALAGASAVPLELAELGAEVARLAAAVAESGKPSLRGDAAAGAILGSAAARVAANLVAINLASRSDEWVRRAGDLAAAASASAERAMEATE
jgi:formiminotetrahydrofolate cyclodeaminase